MEKFSTALRGYEKEEVNNFIDSTIRQVEAMVEELSSKNSELREAKEKLARYEKLEETLNRAILKAEETSDGIRSMARKQSEIIVEEAKNNANRIVNEALLKAEKTEIETATLQKNLKVFKARLKNIVEAQLEIIEDITDVEF